MQRGKTATSSTHLNGIDRFEFGVRDADEGFFAAWARRPIARRPISPRNGGALQKVLKRVLDHAPVLHDDEEIGLRIGDELEALDRIAVDEKEVGERAGL